ncbi:hypothetical protein ACLI4Q_05615 [Natrialbaceae archaeon A-CW1-1]
MIKLKDWSELEGSEEADHMAAKIGETLICADCKWHDGRIFIADSNDESNLITLSLCPDGNIAEIKIGDIILPVI